MLVLLFQGTLRLFFVRLMEHVETVLVKSKFLSVGFNALTLNCRKMSVRYWEGKCLSDLVVMPCDHYALFHLSRVPIFLVVERGWC